MISKIFLGVLMIFLVRSAVGLVPPDLPARLGMAHEGESFFRELHESTLNQKPGVEEWALTSIERLRQATDSTQAQQLMADFGNGTSENATDILPAMPVFNVSAECINATARYLVDLLNGVPYALQMLDATAKPPAGIMEGNMKWFGAMSQCKNTTVTPSGGPHFDAHQCLASFISPAAMINPQQAMFGAITLGLCLPATCTPGDVTNMLNQDLFDVQMLDKYVVYTTTCNDDRKLDSFAIGAIFFGAVFILIVVVATVLDIVLTMMRDGSCGTDDIIVTSEELPRNRVVSSLTSKSLVNNSEPHDSDRVPEYRENDTLPLFKEQQLTVFQHTPGKLLSALLAFSLYTNVPKIMSAKHGSGAITCLHGIRLISMTWVVLGHSYAFAAQIFDNLVVMADILSRFSFQAISNATVSVDTFFVLSGLLVAYLTLKQMKRSDGKINWLLFYFHRYWRLTVTYAFIMVLYIGISPYLISNPAADSFSADATNCRSSWYLDLLYVNNFFDISKGCMGWTWYLANDMQFYIISPIILIALYKLPILGGIMISLLVLSQILTTSLIMHFYNIGTMFNDASGEYMIMVYTKPYVRCGVYALGMAVGYLLYKTDCKVKMNKITLWTGWLLATGLALGTLYGTYNNQITDPWSVDMSAGYEAIYRLTWAVALGWVIFACATGNGGFVNALLSWEAFIPLSRLTYTCYMVHLIVIGIFFGNMETTIHYTDLMIIYVYIGSLVCSMMVAFVVTVLIEAPSIALEKVLLGGFR